MSVELKNVNSQALKKNHLQNRKIIVLNQPFVTVRAGSFSYMFNNIGSCLILTWKYINQRWRTICHPSLEEHGRFQ